MDARTLRHLIVALGAAWLLIATLTSAPSQAADAEPKMVVIALDGVPLRAIRQAREAGAFRDWPREVPLISTFPSLTNVGFTAIMQPFGVGPSDGYEIQHFDVDRNAVVGKSPRRYRHRDIEWRGAFDITENTVGAKMAAYAAPRKKAWKTIERMERLVFESDEALVKVHVGATDALAHLRGDKAIVRFLVRLDLRLNDLKQRYRTVTDRPLRVVLLSDHGNTDLKVRSVWGIRPSLRRAGLNVSTRLEGPNDVVAATFGLVSYGALFTRPEHAGTAALAAVGNEHVDLAAWIAAPGELNIIAAGGGAVVRWRDGARGRSFAYDAGPDDPLQLADALARMATAGLLDDDGFALEDEWLAATATETYPDAPRRLVNALTGPYVRNVATVLLSLKPGFAWGWKVGHATSRFAGGKLEGTHGGLDRESTLGFFLADDPALQPGRAVRADRALTDFGHDEHVAAHITAF